MNIEKDKENSNLKRLNKLLKDNEKQKANLFDSLKICELDDVKKSIFEEISKMEKQHKEIQNEIKLEQVQYLNLEEPQIIYFLTQLRNGSLDNEKYRKTLINVLIYKIYLYDDNVTIVFTTQEEHYEKRVPTIEELECSFKGKVEQPFELYMNIIYFIDGVFSKYKYEKMNLLIT